MLIYHQMGGTSAVLHYYSTTSSVALTGGYMHRHIWPSKTNFAIHSHEGSEMGQSEAKIRLILISYEFLPISAAANQITYMNLSIDLIRRCGLLTVAIRMEHWGGCKRAAKVYLFFNTKGGLIIMSRVALAGV